MTTDMNWIEGPWGGKLAIVSRPRGGDWLEVDVDLWQRAGLNIIVSLLTTDEAAELDLVQEPSICRRMNLKFENLPIPDRGVPRSPDAVLKLIDELTHFLHEGKSVGIHCRQGIGRSAILAASLLAFSGSDPREAVKRISRSRGMPAPETEEQLAWILDFARKLPVSG